MKRRTLLELGGAGAALLAGCTATRAAPQEKSANPVASRTAAVVLASADGERKVDNARLYPVARLLKGQLAQLDYSNWEG